MIANMKRGAVVVDVAIDQGGCFETSHATTHTEPIYFVDGVLHYCVSNMPAAVPHTSTFALTNATFPYLLELANQGLEARLRPSIAALREGVNTYNGYVTHRGRGGVAGPPVARAGRCGVRTEAMPVSAQQAEIPPQPLTALTRRREALSDHRAPVRARADRPVRPRNGRGRRLPQGHHPPVLRAGPDGHRDPRGIRRAGRQLLPGDPGGGRALRGGSFGRRDRGRAEHHLQQRPAALGQRRRRRPATCRGWPRTRWRPMRCRKPDRARTPSPWPRAPRTAATISC